MANTDSEAKTKSAVYYERNVLALAYIDLCQQNGVPTGWWPDTDDINDEPWAVVWANMPGGQVGWHVPLDLVPLWLPKRDPEYDGYSTSEKHRRLHDFHDIPVDADDRLSVVNDLDPSGDGTETIVDDAPDPETMEEP